MNTLTIRPDADDRDLLTNLVLDSRLPGQAREWAVLYLNRLLLGGSVLDRHLAHLDKLFRAAFLRFPSSRERPGRLAAVTNVDPKFRFHRLLTAEQTASILEWGPAGLERAAVFPRGFEVEAAELLLNPYALWDLSDRINSLLPDYWLERMNDYIDELAEEVGLGDEPEVPLFETMEKLQPTGMLATASRVGSPQAQQTETNLWVVTFDAETAGRLALAAYGDATITPTVTLHRVGDAAEIKMAPAPRLDEIVIPVRFRDGIVREFAVQVPPQTRRDMQKHLKEWVSGKSGALKKEAFPSLGCTAEAVGEWFEIVARSCFPQLASGAP